jgi:hypothetical protein
MLMFEMVHGRIAAGETTVVQRLLYYDVESKWKNYHISTFPGHFLSKNTGNVQDALAGHKTFLR